MGPTLSAAEVRERLNLTQNQLDALVAQGVLHPRRDYKGWRKFPLREVEKLTTKNRSAAEVPATSPVPTTRIPPGARAAAAFRMFGEGKNPRDVVIALEVTPAEVENLREKYAKFGREVVLTGRDLETVRELIDWHGTGATDLVRAIDRRLRYQFERGRKLQTDVAAFAERHQKKEKCTSDKHVNAGSGDASGSEGPLRGDGEGEPDSGPGVRSAG